ncbi:hypothetical protein T12_1217 [Trichinella patagoniensis]|uniref:Uncharacterized protein n=2 Tax=Trichinella patagoniensis TaxID=990121 RepID=A0A0V0YZE9_9BILA|nr:hypothetical protein T12_1217 [Trichinella patagoniensis]
MADISDLHLVTGMDQLAACIVPKSLLPERVCTTTDFHHSPNCFSQRRTKVFCTELSKKHFPDCHDRRTTEKTCTNVHSF